MSTKIKDITGQKIGALTPIKIEKINGKSQWLCKCDCGNYYYRTGSQLRYMKSNNGYPTCGCSKIFFNGKIRTIVGIKTSLIEVCSYDKENELYLCINKKNEKELLNSKCIKLRIIHSKSHDEIKSKQDNCAKQYGYSNINEYNKDSICLHHILVLMKKRCYDETSDKFKYYGAKGVTIYEKWLQNPKTFVHWAMLNGFSRGLQIDRIDNNKGYSPENCRWVTRTQNMNNKSNNFYITIEEKTQSLANWCREYNLDYKKTHALIRYKNKSLKEIIKGE